jgi:hypothetical protein
MNPVDLMARRVRIALATGARKIPNIPGHWKSRSFRASAREALLPDTGWYRPLRHPSHPRAWGWRAVQSELGDGNLVKQLQCMEAA